MKQNCQPVSDVNSFITEIVAMARDPIAVCGYFDNEAGMSYIKLQMLVDEEDGSLLKAFRNLVSMATEAREEQKRRVIVSQWDDEDWWRQGDQMEMSCLSTYDIFLESSISY